MGIEIEGFDEVRQFSETIVKENTKSAYLTALNMYVAFTKKDPHNLIVEAKEDAKREQKTQIVKRQLLGFHNFLLKDAEVRDNRGQVVRKGYAPKVADMRVQAIRAFYKCFEISVSLLGREKLPKAKVLNKRRELSASEVKRIVDNTLNLRDKAIFTVAFQTGLRVSGLVDLKYGDMREQLEKGETLLTLRLHDKKSGNDFVTFAGRDSIEAIKTYLSDLSRKGVTLNDNDPLFLRDPVTKRKGIDTHLIEISLKESVKRSGLTGNINPHALRESFSKIMIAHSVPKPVVEQWLAHSEGVLEEAYMTLTEDAMRELYVKNEGFVSLNGAYIKTTVEELKQKNDELSGTVKTLTDMIANQGQLIAKLNIEIDKVKEIVKGNAELEKVFREKGMSFEQVFLKTLELIAKLEKEKESK